MNITEIQAALRALEKRAVTIHPSGGNAYLRIDGEDICARMFFYGIATPTIEGKGDTPEEAITALNAKVDDRDPKLLAATLGVEQL